MQHDFSKCHTTVRLGQFGISVSPTSVAVERAISAINNIVTDLRNRLDETTLNYLLMIFINAPEECPFEVLYFAAKQWLDYGDRRLIRPLLHPRWAAELETERQRMEKYRKSHRENESDAYLNAAFKYLLL
jgi:hypothetical protein